MDIVALDKDGSEMGIISAEDFKSIFVLPRMVQKDTLVRIKVAYSDKNWLLVRDMYSFCDNEVREVVVNVNEYKVDEESIVIMGSMTDEELIDVKADLNIKSPSKVHMDGTNKIGR